MADTNKKGYLADYYLRNRDRLREQRHKRYLEKRDEVIKKVQENRPPPTQERPADAPPLRRRWLVIGDRVYFNTKLGVSQAEMVTVLSDLQMSMRRLEKADKAMLTALRNSQRKHLHFLENQDTYKARMDAYREKVEGSVPRDEPPVGPRTVVSRRRWMVRGERVFFNPTVAFELADILKVMAEQQEAIKRLKSKDSGSARPGRG